MKGCKHSKPCNAQTERERKTETDRQKDRQTEPQRQKRRERNTQRVDWLRSMQSRVYRLTMMTVC